MIKKAFIALVIFMGAAQTTHAYEVSFGLGAAASSSPYRDVDNDWIALPYASFDSEYVFVTFPSAGVHLVNSGSFSLDVKAVYLPHEFKPKDSDHPGMRKLDRRYSTLGAGVSAKLDTFIGSFEAEAVVDVLDKSNGVTAAFIYSNPIPIFSNFIIGPKAGFMWHNNKHNEYYYGISKKESAKSGMRAYDPNNSLSWFAGGHAVFILGENTKIVLEADYLFFGSEIKNSPMVDKNGVWGSYGGIIYSF